MGGGDKDQQVQFAAKNYRSLYKKNYGSNKGGISDGHERGICFYSKKLVEATMDVVVDMIIMVKTNMKSILPGEH